MNYGLISVQATCILMMQQKIKHVLLVVSLHYYHIAENFHWTKILPSPATFILQKYSVEYIFVNVVKVSISSM